MIKAFPLVFAFGLAITGSTAFASSYTYSTSGCFSNSSAPTAGTSASASCTAAGSTFSFSDIGGATETLTYTDQATTTVSGGTIDLGKFSIATTGSGSGASFGANFALPVTFTTPSVSNTFNAILSGNIFGNVGGSTITFFPATENFNSSSGNFTLTLTTDPIQVNTGTGISSEILTATLAPVPEPVTVGLLGCGLALIGVVRFRRPGKTNRS